MNALWATLFVDAIPVSGLEKVAMILPLSLAIAVVYKTIRCADTGQILKEALPLWVTIVGGMYLVGAILWGIFILLA